MFSSIEEILKELQNGRMIVVVDDESRENEGDLIFAGQFVDADKINFMAKYGRGLICVPMPDYKAKELGLSLMTQKNNDHFGTAFTVSVDARKNTSTGISAQDRATTVKILSSPVSTKDDIRVPGHMFPLVSKSGGVLVRAGHTEATTDLLSIAGIEPVGVICEIMNEDGTMARLPQLIKFCKKHKLKICSIADIIEYRRRRERLIKKIVTTKLPTKYGDFKLIVYESILDGSSHLALIMGNPKKNKDVIVRVHSECLTGDVFGSKRCDCGAQLDTAMKMIAEEGVGAIIYMRQEGRGIGLVNKIRSYALQDKGHDTVEANVALGFKPDLREYGIGAQILVDLGISNVRLLTNNPRKVIGLEGYGIKIIERIPIHVGINECNIKYIKTKREKLGHLI
jgi:3,4-dihydroxy 2-butanone 4-phosphate synthase/GTP cyclohydrolase II